MKEFKSIVFDQMPPVNPEVVWVKSIGTGVQVYFYMNGNWHSLADVASSGSYNDLLGKPDLKTVATSGSYNDLSDQPTIPVVSTNVLSDKTDDTKASSPKSIYSFSYPEIQGYTTEETIIPAEEEGQEDTVVETIVIPDMLPNIKYSFGTLTEGTFVLDTTDIDTKIENIWHWTFDTNTEDQISTFTMPQVIWTNGSAPSISAGKYYDIKVVLDNESYYATYTQVSL